MTPEPLPDGTPQPPDEPFPPSPGGAEGVPAGDGHEADLSRHQVPDAVVRNAERWRVVGIALDIVWILLLAVVVGFWVRVTWYPRPDDEVRGFVPVLLAPAAAVGALLAGWAVASAWRLYRRRRSGWDAPVVLGALGVAVSVYSLVPSTTIVPELVWLGVLGTGSAVAGILGERTWRRVA